MGDSNKKRADVLVVGRYFCDLIFSGLPEFPRLGHEVYSREFHLVPGGVFNAAVSLRRLRLEVVWPCDFGSDPFSQFVRRAAEKEDINPEYFSDLDGSSFHLTAAFSFDKERTFLSYSDPLPPYAFQEIIQHTQPAWIYITHLLLGDALVEIADAGRQAGAKLFMDCQAHCHALAEEKVQQALQTVDVFSPNRMEAEQLTGKQGIDEMLYALADFVPTVVIKDGERGSHLINAGKIMHAPAHPVEVADTTGAGDNFDSGFIYGMVRGYTHRDCMRIGNICGALSAAGFGGTSTSPTEAELLQYL